MLMESDGRNNSTAVAKDKLAVMVELIGLLDTL